MEDFEAGSLPAPPTLHAEFHLRDRYLEAVLTGLASAQAAREALLRTGEACDKAGAQRVLINCLGILGQTAQYEHEHLGEVLAQYLKGRRCALVTAPTKIKGVMGAAAKAEGADYGAFGNVADAVAWLCA